jgi:hypothetical protein
MHIPSTLYISHLLYGSQNFCPPHEAKQDFWSEGETFFEQLTNTLNLQIKLEDGWTTLAIQRTAASPQLWVSTKLHKIVSRSLDHI